MIGETIQNPALSWPREFEKYVAQVIAPSQTEELFFDYLPEPGQIEAHP